ncbi:tRNA lysidine(34) synthetase TilS [Bacillus pumilus]|nr:tRNA lysidine(34) synthetase TilS [Bacillus pumilus]AVI39600.1 tRNA lysidine(34) synthetase TilS [Bacillus pumilus]QHQ77746.1 tRNA lysidine(34) synthetase TilS [Bacillus pumilus]
MNRIESFLKKHDVYLENTTVIVGVSGGPDSMLLLHELNKRRKGSFQLIAAHVDHMFRGEESFADLAFVEAYCKEQGIPFESARIQVTQYAKENHLNKQAAARECRYAFFRQLMERYKAQFIALAHHGDDQVETMMMRLARGTVGIGLAGIQAKRPYQDGWLIRPLIGYSKDDVLTACEQAHIPYVIDQSNHTDDYLRNRIRRHILPVLKEEAPHVHESFQFVSDMLTEDEQYLQALTKEQMNQVITNQSPKQIKIKTKPLLDLPLPLQRRGIQLILNYLYENTQSAFSNQHILGTLDWLSHTEQPSGSLDLPKGLQAVKSYDYCMFTFERSLVLDQSYALHLKGEVGEELFLPNGQSIVVSNHVPKDARNGNHFFLLQKDRVRFPLIIRSRKNGDRIKLKGMNGSKKVKDIFIDKKVPLAERDSWPIVTDSDHQIIWIPGLKKSVFEEIDMTNSDLIVLQYRQHENL